MTAAIRLLAAFEALTGAVKTAARWAMLGMAATIFGIVLFTVFSRYGFGSVLSWSEEVPRYLLVWIAMLGGALAVERGDHIGFELIVTALPRGLQGPVRGLVTLGIAAFGGIMVVYGVRFVELFGGDWMESIPFTNAWFYVSVPVAGGLILLFVLGAGARRSAPLARGPPVGGPGGGSVTIAVAIGAFVVLLLLSVPISFAIGLAAVVAGATLWSVDNTTVVQQMVAAVNSFPLLAVIFFIFAGVLMARGGISTRLVRMSEVVVGRVPGGLAQINILSSMLFGGVSGSAVADVSSIGSMMIPAMEKDGYRRDYATSVTLTSAVMGPIIPPSIPMILYAHVTGSVSVAGLFLAGAIPGLLIGLGLMGAAAWHGHRYHGKRLPAIPRREKVRRVIDGLAGLMTLVIILGGITSGIFTATEAGAVAAFYALVLTVFIYREVRWRDLPGILHECCLTNGVVLFLVATTSIFTWILTHENLPTLLSETVLGLTDNPTVLLLLINLILLFVGLFIDLTPAVIMLVPILMPLADGIGLHPIHLGVIVVVNLSLGLITPPVGTSLFVGCRIAGLPITAVVRPMLPLVAIMVSVLMMMTYFPGLYMWLPRWFGFV